MERNEQIANNTALPGGVDTAGCDLAGGCGVSPMKKFGVEVGLGAWEIVRMCEYSHH